MVCNLEVYKEPWSPVLSNTTVPRDWGKEHCPVIVSKPRMTSQSRSTTPGQISSRGRSCQTALKGPEHQGRKLRRARQAETTPCTSELEMCSCPFSASCSFHPFIPGLPILPRALSAKEKILPFSAQSLRPLNLVLCKEQWAGTPRSGLLETG